ncbi:hypothetical protein COL154_013960 [Colletotrichum chrysophilum]|nr:hypothetical protein COL154_013960 [Colletotrichum chrysophilum]
MARDHILAEFGNWLKRNLRDIDMVGRWGGDEFVFILTECDLASAQSLMERMQKNLSRFKPFNIPITVSVGLAVLRLDKQDTLNTLFELADKAMYQAKMAGRDCIVCYEDEQLLAD